MSKKRNPAKKNNRPRGRPTKYTTALIDRICEKISTSEVGLHAICQENGFPHFSQVFRWLNDEKKGKDFREKYARAREAQADFMAEKILKIADECREGRKTKTRETDKGVFVENELGDMVERSRLQIDARKWLASKLAPKKYGDKLDLTSGGNVIAPPVPVQIVNPHSE